MTWFIGFGNEFDWGGGRQPTHRHALGMSDLNSTATTAGTDNLTRNRGHTSTRQIGKRVESKMRCPLFRLQVSVNPPLPMVHHQGYTLRSKFIQHSHLKNPAFTFGQNPALATGPYTQRTFHEYAQPKQIINPSQKDTDTFTVGCPVCPRNFPLQHGFREQATFHHESRTRL